MDDDAPTEPAISPEWPVQLQHIQGRVYGPQPEPERYAIRFIMNDGQWTPKEHEEQLRSAAQAINVHQWDRECRAELS